VVNDLAVHYSYDVMTQLAFGERGGFIDNTSSDSANDVVDGLHTAFDIIGLLNHVPWMMKLLTVFSFLPGPMRAVNDWSAQALKRRKKVRTFPPAQLGTPSTYTTKGLTERVKTTGPDGLSYR
jgi:hypothetical protein